MIKGVHVGVRKSDWGKFSRIQDRGLEKSYLPKAFTGYEALTHQMFVDAMTNISGTSPMIVEGEAILAEPWMDAKWLLVDARDELGMTEEAYSKIRKAVFKSEGYKVLVQRAKEDGNLKAELARHGVDIEESV